MDLNDLRTINMSEAAAPPNANLSLVSKSNEEKEEGATIVWNVLPETWGTYAPPCRPYFVAYPGKECLFPAMLYNYQSIFEEKEPCVVSWEI